MVEVIDNKSKELAIEFYEWMLQYQDLSCAIRLNYVDSVDELFTKFLEDKYNDRG